MAGIWRASGAADVVPAPLPVEVPSLLFSTLRVLGALGFVFALFLLGIWLFRNWQRLTIQRGKIPKLNVLEVKSLGPRQALYVVGYEEQRFLLSSAPTGVSMLASLPAAVPVSKEEAATPPQANFLEFLLKAAARK
jgi:flagellar biogenesis protein FliO